MKRGPVGAPNSRQEGWARFSQLQLGDHVKIGEGWETVVAVHPGPNTIGVMTDAGTLLAGRPRQLTRAVRCDRDRDAEGYRACPTCGARHNREGSYCSDPCHDEAHARLLGTRAEARDWVANEWTGRSR